MTAINTNVGALNARLYTLQADKRQSNAMERISSGLRVNSAADDAAGLAVAGKMESQLRFTCRRPSYRQPSSSCPSGYVHWSLRIVRERAGLSCDDHRASS